jgi:hypothetical protein
MTAWKERPAWGHNCLRVPGHEGIPTKIYMQGCGCTYCGQPDPEEQAKIDALAAKKLVDTKPLKPKGGKP